MKYKKVVHGGTKELLDAKQRVPTEDEPLGWLRLIPYYKHFVGALAVESFQLAPCDWRIWCAANYFLLFGQETRSRVDGKRDCRRGREQD